MLKCLNIWASSNIKAKRLIKRNWIYLFAKTIISTKKFKIFIFFPEITKKCHYITYRPLALLFYLTSRFIRCTNNCIIQTFYLVPYIYAVVYYFCCWFPCKQMRCACCSTTTPTPTRLPLLNRLFQTPNALRWFLSSSGGGLKEL